MEVKYPAVREYPADAARAVLQAQLDFPSLTDIHTYETAGGTRVEGIAHAEATMNFG